MDLRKAISKTGLTGLFLFVITIGCSKPPADFSVAYKLSKPDKIYLLEDELDEISGMTYLGDKKIAVIQDEKGIIYIYSLKSEKVKKEIDFAAKADFEGLAMKGSTYYALASDGGLFIVDHNADSDGGKIRKTALSSAKNAEIEGFCFHKKKQFLVAYKTHSGFGGSDARGIFTWKINRGYHSALPIFTITNDKIRRYIESRKDGRKKLEKLLDDAGKSAVFNPSGIAVHPLTGDIYLVSGVNELLMVIDRKAEHILYLHQFDDDLLSQPEGITFDNDGDMYISSEKGSGKHARIVRFEMKK